MVMLVDHYVESRRPDACADSADVSFRERPEALHPRLALSSGWKREGACRPFPRYVVGATRSMHCTRLLELDVTVDGLRAGDDDVGARQVRASSRAALRASKAPGRRDNSFRFDATCVSFAQSKRVVGRILCSVSKTGAGHRLRRVVLPALLRCW